MGPVRIEHSSDIEQLRRRRPRWVPAEEFQIAVVGLPPAESEMWSVQLRSHYSACGCESGTAALVVALGLYVIWLAAQSGGLSAAGWSHVWVGVGISFGSAAFGKILGVIYAGFRIRALTGALERRLVEREGLQS